MDWVPVLGRVLMSVLFIYNGVNHFTNHSGLVQYAQSGGAPAPKLTVPLTGAILLLGGISVLLGYRMDIGLPLLALFLVPTAVIMHRFWGVADAMVRVNQMAHFMKNVALGGAALWMWWAYVTTGAGPWSLE